MQQRAQKEIEPVELERKYFSKTWMANEQV